MVVNTINDEATKLTATLYKYKNYIDGKIIYDDNATAEAKMNFNQLSGKMLFISPEGDTLEFAKPEIFSMIIAGVDTFYYFEKKYLEKVTHYDAYNLAVNRTLKMIGREKKGAYGTYSGVSSVNSDITFTNDDQITNAIMVDENVVFKFSNSYYISDKFNNFFPANKKNFIKIFFAHEKELKSFLDLKHINFGNKTDLIHLLDYAQSLI